MARETRECVRCFGSGRIAHCETPTAQPVIVDCGTCSGSGTVSVFLYSTRTTLRRMAESEVVYLAWHGSAREQMLAEKELRRRS